MTERKPQGMSFTSWIDQQIADAERRGLFDNLPGAGKPLDLKPAGGDYGQAWVHDYARREGVPPAEFLPAPLRLRREIEQLAETVGDMDSEQEVREAVADLNRRILQWRRMPVGPPIFVRLVNKDEMLARWRSAQAAKRARPPQPPTTGPAAQPGGAGSPGSASGSASPRRKRLGWWRRRRLSPERGGVT